jgi:hypothetical protein
MMPLPTDDDICSANEYQDEAIAALVAAAALEPKRLGSPRYTKAVYNAAWKVMEACQAVQANYEYKITDLKEYEAEVERRRQIGLTIDPTTAETMFWWADCSDPYHLLDESHKSGCVGRVQLARHPGAPNRDWVEFGDLPEATYDALYKRDGHKLDFPYGLNTEHDIINKPGNACAR